MEPTPTISSISDLLSVLKNNPEPTSMYWYRGQSNVDWKLLPALARRQGDLTRESDLLARFKQNASLLLQPLPISDWGWLTVMQHYRVPTRLLDWTESPLVALYFAVDTGHETDGALWILDPTRLNSASRISPDYDRYIPSFEDDATLNYLPSSLRAETISRLEPIAVIGPRNTPRMQAQLGVFTVIHRDPIAIEDVSDHGHVRKYSIPKDAKDTLRKELSTLTVNKFQLFPDLQSLGEILGEG